MSISNPEINTPFKYLSDEAIETQIRQTLQIAQSNGNGRDLPVPVIITLEFDKIDILSWLQSVNQTPKVYWCSRDNGFEIGGIGSTITVTTQDPELLPKKLALIEEMIHNSPENSKIGFIGGTNFDLTSKKNSNWQNFPTLWFVLPEVFIHRQNDSYFISISSLFDNGRSIADLKLDLMNKIKSLDFSNGKVVEASWPKVLSRTNYPEWPEWQTNVQESLKKIKDREIEKVVLARRTDLKFSHQISWEKVVRAFKKRNKNCFIYCFQPIDGVNFLGATPERLFKTKGRTLLSEAVSGTIPRSESPVEDMESGNYLLNSEKNLHEHEFVVDAIKKIKNRLCDNIYAQPSPSLLKLTNVHHLYTRISGKLRDNVSTYDILSTLHPTPAVGGTPRSKALNLINKLEPFDRGWYAAPIGIICRDWSEIVIALRSVLLVGNSARIFAGAGIVQGSEPRAEWDELESKISIALDILNEK
ncbi:isochorismate synthase [candidate division KSB1 bacterium]|nr:isochorismate synthase [candidate division KSB1 bacterium]